MEKAAIISLSGVLRRIINANQQLRFNIICTVGFVEALPAAPQHMTKGNIHADESRSRQTALQNSTMRVISHNKTNISTADSHYRLWTIDYRLWTIDLQAT